jgi:hypothetical protein
MNTMFKSWVVGAAFCLVGVLAGCSSVSEADRQAAASAPKLTGPEIAQVISGNSLNGVTNKNESWSEYYQENGTIRGTMSGSNYEGAWRVEGDKLCFDYRDDSYDGCDSVAVQGNKMYFLGEDGSLSGRPATLSEGNPFDL